MQLPVKYAALNGATFSWTRNRLDFGFPLLGRQRLFPGNDLTS